MRVVRAKQPVVTSIDDKLSKLVEDWEVIFVWEKKRYRLAITKGFIFDGASIPSVFWTILRLAPHGIMDGPALPHDAGYEVQGVFTLEVDGKLVPAPLTGGAVATLEVCSEGPEVRWTLTPKCMSKKNLDELLRLLCIHFGLTIRSKLVWLGVRVAGGFAWKSDDKSRKYKLLEALS